MEATISKTFGMTLRIEVDPENDGLLTRYFDTRYQAGTLHDIAARLSAGSGYSRAYQLVMKRAGTWDKNLSVDHINGKPADNRRHNLQMLSMGDNLRKRAKRTVKFAIPTPPRTGLRLYSVYVDAVFDLDNEDLLQRMTLAYEQGRMYRSIMSSLIGVQMGSSSLARRILSANDLYVPTGMTVDHINGDAGDNRFQNLRVVTQAQNLANRHYFTYPAALTA